MIKYGNINEPLQQEEFNTRLEFDMEFNNRWYEKI